MPQKHKSTALADWLVESSPVLEVAAGMDPFLDFAAIESDADDWLELLAYSWGVEGLDTTADDRLTESDRVDEEHLD